MVQLYDMLTDKALKIVVLGPSATGKSTIANLLAHQLDLQKVAYYPTKSVRILEMDVATEDSRNLAVQLWDCGGDKHNQRHWNSFLYKADGLIMVHDPDRSLQEPELETLLYFFVQRPHSAILRPLAESRVLIIANHHKTTARSRRANVPRLPPDVVGRMREIHVSPAENPAAIAAEFNSFINSIYKEITVGVRK